MPHKDPEARRAYMREWSQRYFADPENREKRKAYYRNSDQRKRSYQYDLERRARIDELKQGKPCADCGGIFPPVCMDFDHLGTDKIFNVSAMVRHSWVKILAEIAKCELVCANCHRIRTAKRKAGPWAAKLAV